MVVTADLCGCFFKFKWVVLFVQKTKWVESRFNVVKYLARKGEMDFFNGGSI